MILIATVRLQARVERDMDLGHAAPPDELAQLVTTAVKSGWHCAAHCCSFACRRVPGRRVEWKSDCAWSPSAARGSMPAGRGAARSPRGASACARSRVIIVASAALVCWSSRRRWMRVRDARHGQRVVRAVERVLRQHRHHELRQLEVDAAGSGGTGLFTCAAAMSTGVAPVNGGCLHRPSYATTPSE